MPFESLSGHPDPSRSTRPDDLAGWRYEDKLGYPGRVSVHARRLPDDVPRPAVDDADVRGLRAARGHQRALQVPARAGPDRALDRVRHARADGLRRRPPAGARRGRQGRRVDLDARRLRARCSPTSRSTDVTTSMTINCTASVALAMYLALAEKQGVSWDRVGGTMQNDMLKEFIAQKEWICPPESGGAHRGRHDRVLRAKHVPRFNPVSISGYHIREAGSTAVQELAFTLADGLGYVEAAHRARARRRQLRAAAVVLLRHPQRLLRGDRQAPGGAAHLGALHEGALRRARSRSRCACGRTPRPPASRRPPSSRSTTSRGSRSRPWPPCSAARSRCTPTPTTRRWRLPTEEAVTVALRTQQIIAEETGRRAHHRPARRLVLPRDADRPDGGAARSAYIRTIDEHGRHRPRHRRRLSAAGDRGRRVSLPAHGRPRARRSSSASTST